MDALRKSASQQRHRPAGSLARGLAWFSLGLGVAQLLAPSLVGRAVGASGRPGGVRATGLREITAGLGILLSRQPAPWLWGRVAGDVVDLGVLARHVGERNPRRVNALVALAAVAGVAVVDLACARSLSRKRPAIARDYSGRRGLPLPPEEMRGAARADFEMPGDFRTPEALRPYLVH